MSDSTFPDLMNALVEAAEISDLTIEDDRYACSPSTTTSLSIFVSRRLE